MFKIVSIAIGAACLMAGIVNAAVVIGGTRVVFPADRRDVSVRIQNKGDEPALVQVWIDDGDEASTPQSAKAPFVITPPVFRIDPGRGHALRIVHVGDTAPVEREKLYWLNVLEIPPKVDESEATNVLQFAFRHRLKLFHRPKKLDTPPEQAPASLRWSLVRNGEKTELRVDNSSPYIVSFNDIQLVAGDGSDAPHWGVGGGMVAPAASTSFSIVGKARVSEATKVAFAVINDFGAVVPRTADLTP